MRYCTKCVNVDTRPDTGEFVNGVCPACRLAEEMKNQKIDFLERRKELSEIIQWGKENSRSSYDCIVTISGGKDSTRQAFFARDELGLKPLLVSCVFPPEHIHERGSYNLSNLISHGFDTVSISLNPKVWKKLMLQGFLNFGNYMKSTELALYSTPIHIAIAYKIPLIFLGENPLYTVGQQEGKTQGGDATGMKYSNTLGGGTPDKSLTQDINLKDLYFYYYPSDDEIDYLKLRIVYLGYYIEDWSFLNNANFAVKHGLKVREDPPEKTGDCYGYAALEDDYKIVNHMIKYVKFGYGSIPDLVCEAINQGVMNRDEAIELLRKYDGKCDQSYINRFCQYLDIPEKKFWDVVESYRGKDVWTKDANDQWELRYGLPE